MGGLGCVGAFEWGLYGACMRACVQAGMGPWMGAEMRVEGVDEEGWEVEAVVVDACVRVCAHDWP